MSHAPRPAPRSAFTIIELLTVILIITLVVAITVPPLASARKSARKAETLAQLNTMQQAVESFTTDNRRAPGYFSQIEMGDMTNQTRGFSQMQNILLDLVGGIDVQANGTAAAGSNPVGPTATATVAFSVSKMGTGAKNYFISDNVIEASWSAMVDAIRLELMRLTEKDESIERAVEDYCWGV